jgi:hypothetical protein
MIWPAVVGDDQQEVGYARVKNVSGAAFARGDVVAWDVSSPDGIRVSTPATATLGLAVGVLAAALANGAYGPCQVYGYTAYAYVTNHATQAIAAGDILIAVDAGTHLARSGPSDGKSGWFHAAEAVAAITTTTLAAKALKKVIIRAA